MIFSKPYHILLIDDDESMHHLLKRYLDLKYEGDVLLTYCSSLDTASKYLSDENHTIHVAIVDIHLSNGEDSWSIIKECLKVERGIQVIALSADKKLLTAIECYNLGAKFFIDKPVDKAHVYDVLDRCIDHLDYWHTVVRSRLSGGG